HSQIVESLERRFRSWLRPVPSAAGLHLAAVVAGTRTNIARAVHRARDRGVSVGLLSNYCVEEPFREGVVIGYGAIPTSRIDEGLRRLAASFT
ncbi:MAG TPA: hypothetical protein VKB50_10775, partial [Vicinamibacterales bacterium]|nr:hypothetical protein [Vicinamibacterales bacterium]